MEDLYLAHHGIKGQKWGVRRYQDDNGTLTEEGRKRYRAKSEYGKAYKINSDAAEGNLERSKAYRSEMKDIENAYKNGETSKRTYKSEKKSLKKEYKEDIRKSYDDAIKAARDAGFNKGKAVVEGTVAGIGSIGMSVLSVKMITEGKIGASCASSIVAGALGGAAISDYMNAYNVGIQEKYGSVYGKRK